MATNDDVLTIGDKIFQRSIPDARRNQFITDVAAWLHKRFVGKMGTRRIFDDSAVAEDLMEIMTTNHLVVPGSNDALIKAIRVFSSVYMIHLVIAETADYHDSVVQVFSIGNLKELFKANEESSDFSNLDCTYGTDYWGTLHRFALGMSCLMAVHTGKQLNKDIVITAVGYFSGSVHSCTGDSPGRMALCYEYIYRCIGQQNYIPKLRRGSSTGPRSNARRKMMALLPDLLKTFGDVLQSCMSVLREPSAPDISTLGKKRPRRDHNCINSSNSSYSSSSQSGEARGNEQSFPTAWLGINSTSEDSSRDNLTFLGSHPIQPAAVFVESADNCEDIEFFPLHHDKQALSTFFA
eukprot:gene28353-34231_t